MKKPEFSLATASLLSNFAKEAYNSLPELDVKQYGFELVHFIDNSNTDTQCFVARDYKRIIVAFRGTSSLQDLLTDFQNIQAAYPPTIRWFFKPKVHAGFLEAYKSIKKGIHDHIELLLSQNPSSKLLVTGHGLGGCLATIAAVDLYRTFKRPVTLYTYGSPKVGNLWFARKFNGMIKDSFRVVNVDDVIPEVQPLPGYTHIDTLVTIDEKGEIRVNPSVIEPVMERLDDVSTVLAGQQLDKHASSHYQKSLNDLVKTSEDEMKLDQVSLINQVRYYPIMRINTEYPVEIYISRGKIFLKEYKGQKVTETRDLGKIDVGKVLQVRLLSPALNIAPETREIVITADMELDTRLLFKVVPAIAGKFTIAIEFWEIAPDLSVHPRIIDTTHLEVDIQNATKAISIKGYKIHLTAKFVSILSVISSVIIFLASQYDQLGIDIITNLDKRLTALILLVLGLAGLIFLILGWFFGIKPFEMETDPKKFII